MSKDNKYICIHGHFYQPPRENPWLEAIEMQDSAAPFHDWNERITAECYAVNAASRILNGEGLISEISNNYSKISFNIGPTLLSWMKDKASDIYEAILVADRESQKKFSGHGSAMAQVFNHMVMPLANRRDKISQIRWGIWDFKSRFGRDPEGMWLAETAVDLETLELLVDHGIKFTILSPYQAGRVKASGSGHHWKDVSGARINPFRAYEQNLPSGKKIALFFYDAPVSQAVAFEGLLNRGENFSGRLLSLFASEEPQPKLVHIATDGETYGHHHRFGDMALAYALHAIERDQQAILTNYGEFLEKFPPRHQVEIIERSAWSCAHGVERWNSNCGCNTGGRPGWNQEWRRPLRAALDWLRDMLIPIYEEQGSRLFKDPWLVRDEYIDVILDRSPETQDAFFSKHTTHELNHSEKIAALKLLEMQRHAMLMYTSCGWFFDELSGIETVQVIQYAGRALQLAEHFRDAPLEPEFLKRLEEAKSNIPENGDGRTIYNKFVKPAMVDLQKVGAHYAISSLFEDYGDQTQIYCFNVQREDMQVLPVGRARLTVGKAIINSAIIPETHRISFGVLHLGDHNISGGVRDYQSPESFSAMVKEITEPFSRADLPSIIRLVDKHFGSETYTLKLLFKDEQRKIISQILNNNLMEANALYRQVYETDASLMRFLTDLGIPLPQEFSTAAQYALNGMLREALQQPELNFDAITAIVNEAKITGVSFDRENLSYIFTETINRLAALMEDDPNELRRIQDLFAAVKLAHQLNFDVDLWRTQNIYFIMYRNLFPESVKKTRQGNEEEKEWLENFKKLGECLNVHVKENVPKENLPPQQPNDEAIQTIPA